MQQLTGYSRQHLSRLITQYRESKYITPKTRASRTSFSHKHTREDMRLLACRNTLFCTTPSDRIRHWMHFGGRCWEKSPL